MGLGEGGENGEEGEEEEEKPEEHKQYQLQPTPVLSLPLSLSPSLPPSFPGRLHAQGAKAAKPSAASEESKRGRHDGIGGGEGENGMGWERGRVLPPKWQKRVGAAGLYNIVGLWHIRIV